MLGVRGKQLWVAGPFPIGATPCRPRYTLSGVTGANSLLTPEALGIGTSTNAGQIEAPLSGGTGKVYTMNPNSGVIANKSDIALDSAVALNTAKVTNARFDDRLNEVGNISASTLALDFDLYEGWDAVLTEALTLSITNPKFKVVTVDLSGDFAITYPTNSTVVGDTYDGTVRNTLTIHYTDATNILVIVTNWA